MNDFETLPRIPDIRAAQRSQRTGSAAPDLRLMGAGAVDGEASGKVAQAGTREQKAPRAADPRAVEQAISELNQYAQNLQRSLQFSVDKASGQTIVRVLDATTKEVIRQIPSEEFLAIAERLRQQSNASTTGVLVQASA